jgi:hypothetical protein
MSTREERDDEERDDAHRAASGGERDGVMLALLAELKAAVEGSESIVGVEERMLVEFKRLAASGEEIAAALQKGEARNEAAMLRKEEEERKQREQRAMSGRSRASNHW